MECDPPVSADVKVATATSWGFLLSLCVQNEILLVLTSPVHTTNLSDGRQFD